MKVGQISVVLCLSYQPGFVNGYRWMEYGTVPTEQCREMSFADDYKAIKWLNETIVGTPVVAEAAIGAYRGNG